MTDPAGLAEGPLVLAEFLPYRLSVLANRVSRDLSNLYAEQFDLTVTQWRVLAILGQYPGVSADEVCQHSEMDKVAVSRAVRRLRSKSLINRRVDPADRRKSVLTLSAKGKKTYLRIIPLAHAYERRLLTGLSAKALVGLSQSLEELDRVTL